MSKNKIIQKIKKLNSKAKISGSTPQLRKTLEALNQKKNSLIVDILRIQNKAELHTKAELEETNLPALSKIKEQLLS